MARRKNIVVWLSVRLICVAAILFTGCQSEDAVIVYADPWLSGFADRIELEFEKQYPNRDLQVKEISSEVIAQHLHFGQPVDVFLCFGPSFLREDVRDMIGEELHLATSEILLIRGPQDARQEQFKTKGCTVVEASDRPLRNYAAQAFPQYFEEDSCKIVADFPAQTQDYLLRHWVKQGFVPAHFTKVVRNDFEIIAKGPLIVNAFCAIQPLNAPHTEAADDLMRLLSSAESKKILADLGYVP